MFSQSKNIKLNAAQYLLIASVLFALPAVAQDKNKTAPNPNKIELPGDQPQQPQSPDKLDVSDLEKKYWAAKDTDFSVVQNRTYAKEKRFALSAQYGTLLTDPYSEGPLYNAALNYYFTERHGVEVTYQSADLKDSKAVENYKTLSGAVLPNHNKIKSYYGVAYNWVPVYAKVSVLNKKIIYFDMAFSPGIGVMSYDAQMDPIYSGPINKSAVTLSFDVTQTFFVNRHIALRVDFKNKWYTEKILKSSGAGGPSGGGYGSELQSSTANNSFLMVGVQLFY